MYCKFADSDPTLQGNVLKRLILKQTKLSVVQLPLYKMSKLFLSIIK